MPTGLSLAALDEMLDEVEGSKPRQFYMPAGFWKKLLQLESEFDQIQWLGYSSRRAYLRDLRKAAEIHGPRLLARLEVTIALARVRRAEPISLENAVASEPSHYVMMPETRKKLRRRMA